MANTNGFTRFQKVSPDSRSCNPFCWILLHEEEQPEQKQKLNVNVRMLRKHVVCAEKVPGDESHLGRNPEELAEEMVFSPVSRNWSIRPVSNIPAGYHEVFHSGRVVHGPGLPHYHLDW